MCRILIETNGILSGHLMVILVCETVIVMCYSTWNTHTLTSDRYRGP